MFFDFGVKDIIDIVLVALMLYYIYRLMKESRSLNVFIGIIVLAIVIAGFVPWFTAGLPDLLYGKVS